MLVILTIVGAFAVVPSAPAMAASCTGAVDNDFNGDGVRDVASADPLASVGAIAKAGTVTVINGSTGGVTVLSQDSANIPGGAEAGDQWGSSLVSYDANADGCSDLVVGAPFEDIGAEADAGAVWILYGSTSGLTTAASFDQSQDAVPGAAEAGDWFGYSLSASKTSGGVPFLLAGAPGEDIGTTVDAGTAGLYRAGTWVLFDQSTAGYPDTDLSDSVAATYEANDRFGYSVAADAYHIAVGAPGETVAGNAFTGEVAVYSNTLTSGFPTLLRAESQYGALSGAAEPNDLFGTSLSMAVHHPSGASSLLAQSLIAVGVPGEDIAANGVELDSAGRVMVLLVNESGAVSELGGYAQDLANVDGDLATGDHFGQRVLVVNRNPSGYASASTMLMAVGIPGKDVGGVVDAGQVHVFSLVGQAGDADVLVQPGAVGLSGSAAPQDLLGLGFSASANHLYVPTPYAATQAVYAVPWNNIVSAAGASVTAYKAGSGSIPAGVAFAAAVS